LAAQKDRSDIYPAELITSLLADTDLSTSIVLLVSSKPAWIVFLALQVANKPVERAIKVSTEEATRFLKNGN
jgi:hypothetical protein